MVKRIFACIFAVLKIKKSMNELFTVAGLSGLLALTFMEIMLGIDNVIFVSIIMDKIPDVKQKKTASRIWMGVGLLMRLLLLYVLGFVIDGKMILFTISNHPVTLSELIMIGGGLFLLVNTVLELHNKLEGEEEEEIVTTTAKQNFGAIVRKIVILDLVFSFDSIVTAIGMAKDNPIVQIFSVVIAMLVMFVFAGKISSFIQKHPTFKVLALSFLMLIGFVLIIDGINVAHIPHGFIYFAMVFSFGVEVLNLQIRKKSKKVVQLNQAQTTESTQEMIKNI
jgi:predicted tellurium resistance membrane protein TerC